MSLMHTVFIFFVNLTCLIRKRGSLKILMCVTFWDAVNKMTKLGVTVFCFNGPYILLRKHGTSLALILRKYMFSKSVSLNGFFA